MSATEHAARLRAARAYAGQEQPDIAKALNVSVRTYSRLEAGSRPLTADELGIVAEYCGVPRTFMESGWGPLARPITESEQRIHALEREVKRISALEENLRALRRELAGTALRRAAQAAESSKRKSEDPHEQDHRPGRTGGEGR